VSAAFAPVLGNDTFDAIISISECIQEHGGKLTPLVARMLKNLRQLRTAMRDIEHTMADLYDNQQIDDLAEERRRQI
jgi:DNA-binding IscR family transcriptional regulator